MLNVPDIRILDVSNIEMMDVPDMEDVRRFRHGDAGRPRLGHDGYSIPNGDDGCPRHGDDGRL